MAGVGRNERCPCGSGRKVKRCCGVRRGPSEDELAKAFLAVEARGAAWVLRDHDDEQLDELHDALIARGGGARRSVSTRAAGVRGGLRAGCGATTTTSRWTSCTMR